MSDYHDATIDLLEAAKAEVDKRWVRHASLWETVAFNGSCILGCLGFARWGEGFRREGQNEGYINLGLDPPPHGMPLPRWPGTSAIGYAPKIPYRTRFRWFIARTTSTSRPSGM